MLLMLWLFTQMSKTMFYRSTSEVKPESVSHLARKRPTCQQHSPIAMSSGRNDLHTTRAEGCTASETKIIKPCQQTTNMDNGLSWITD